MKTTFSRTFSTLVTVLLVALLLVGISFQALVKDYLTDSAIGELKKNSTAFCHSSARGVRPRPAICGKK